MSYSPSDHLSNSDIIACQGTGECLIKNRQSLLALTLSEEDFALEYEKASSPFRRSVAEAPISRVGEQTRRRELGALHMLTGIRVKDLRWLLFRTSTRDQQQEES